MKHAREGGPVRYRARVEYDGTEFAGFQAQPGRRTVQGELERVLAHLSGEPTIRIKAAGRTDAGVHATGQVIAFTWSGGMAASELGQAIGALLPPDVAIGPLTRVALDFDPRRAATRREYRYSIWTGPRRPLGRRTVYELDEPLDAGSHARGRPAAGRPARLLGLRARSGHVCPDALSRSGYAGEATWSRSTWPATPSCSRWCEASWPPSSVSGWDGPQQRTSTASCARRDGPSKGRSSPHTGFACGGW